MGFKDHFLKYDGFYDTHRTHPNGVPKIEQFSILLMGAKFQWETSLAQTRYFDN